LVGYRKVYSGRQRGRRRYVIPHACSIRRDVKNILLPPPEARLWFAASSPLSDRSDARVLCLALWVLLLLHLSSCMFGRSDNADRFLKLASTRGCTVSVYGVNHGSICDSRPSAFSGYPRGHRVNTEAQCHGHCAPTGVKDAHPRTRASQRTNWPPPEKDHRRWRALPVRRSSGLRFQFVSVEVFSLLP